MPIMKYSAMDTSGTWRPDAMDQVEQWNAQRGDQLNQFNTSRRDQMSAEDWRKEVALKQLGLQETMWKGGREDAAAMRQLEADRFGKQFGYMSERDKLMDARAAAREAAEGGRWQQSFDLQKGGIEAERAYRAQEMAERQNERESYRPLRDMQTEIAKAELAERQRQQAAMAAAAGGAAYTPTTDSGREEYQATLAATGNPLQAGIAAKSAERARAGESAKAAMAQLESMMQDFYERDRAVIGSEPTPQDSAAIIRQTEALKALMKRAGNTDEEIAAAVAQIARRSMTTGGRTDINAGPTEDLLSQLGATYR